MYSTSQIASLLGLHPNTIRFYEKMELLQNVERRPNGYRVFNEGHLAQLRLIRTGFRSEILADNLRTQVIDLLKAAAAGDRETALAMAEEYGAALAAEKIRAEEAIRLARRIALGYRSPGTEGESTTRGRAAGQLGISIDVLRDWERNGLIAVPRLPGGQRRYGVREMERLEIIRILRRAHYSQMAILRMLTRLDGGDLDMARAIDTPGEEEDVIGATDRYITALSQAQADAEQMCGMIRKMGQLRK